MASMKKKATPRGYGSSKSDREFAKTTGVGKTAQASRGMNLFAKENIPKGYTVEKVKLKSGNYIGVVGRTTNPAVAKTVRSQQSGYRNPVGVSKTVRSQPSGYQNPNAPGNKKTVAPTARVKKNPFKKSPRSR